MSGWPEPKGFVAADLHDLAFPHTVRHEKFTVHFKITDFRVDVVGDRYLGCRAVRRHHLFSLQDCRRY